jgi:hypothetical protein
MTALNWKLVIDTRDAQTQADFWAEALGYTVEDPSPLIEHLLSAGELPEAAVAEHGGHRVFRGLAAVRHPEDPHDPFTGMGRGRRILFQDVPEAKSAKNRLHIDVHAEPGERDDRVALLESLGATRVEEFDKGPAGHWWVMRDPEGNEFCVA